jgi:hypothetical protein
MYPEESLDNLDYRGLMPEVPESIKSEWEYSDYLMNLSKDFIFENPLIFLKLTALKFWLYFVAPVTPPCCEPGGILKYVNNIYLLLFRIIFWGSLIMTFKYWFTQPKQRNQIVNQFLVYSIVLGLFSGFYIVGFAYERHITPIIIPTLLYAFVVSGYGPKYDQAE